MTDTHVQLGQRFVTLLEETLTPAEWSEMLRRNATPEYNRACASHDFVDANVIMDRAFHDVLGRDPYYMPGNFEPGEDLYQPDTTEALHAADNALWGAAWDWAKAHYLTDNVISRALEADGWPEVNA